MPRKPRVPRSPTFDALLPYLGEVRSPTTRRDRLVEFIDGELMFNRTDGFDDFVFITRETLVRFGEDVSSKLGQYVLEKVVLHAKEEYFGDFDHWRSCGACEEEFRPRYSVIFANALIAGTVCCPKCGEANAY